MKSIILICLAICPLLSFSQNLKVGQSWIDEDRSLIYSIATDSITHDRVFGESYRLFQIQESFSKEIVFKEYLPVNLSADFPYSLITEYYDFYDVLIIKGIQCFFLYFPDNSYLSKKICPDLSDCEISDAQDTYIRNVEIKGDQFSPLVKFLCCLGTIEYDVNSINNEK